MNLGTVSKKIFFGLFLVFVSTSCSYMSRRSTAPDEEMVPKVQYDQLREEYDNLLKSVQGKDLPAARVNEDTKVEEESKKEVAQVTPKASTDNKISFMGDAQNRGENDKEVEISEVVDVVPEILNSPSQTANTAETPTEKHISDESLEREVEEFETAKKFFKNGQFKEAEEKLQKISESNSLQVRVRAKFFIAEIKYQQKDYKSAFDLYEDIVQNYAFSGIVIKTLDRLIDCGQKLGLKEKYEQYYSMRHDFFTT